MNINLYECGCERECNLITLCRKHQNELQASAKTDRTIKYITEEA